MDLKKNPNPTIDFTPVIQPVITKWCYSKAVDRLIEKLFYLNVVLLFFPTYVPWILQCVLLLSISCIN